MRRIRTPAAAAHGSRHELRARDYVQVQRSERVLVVAEIDTDPLVVGSLAKRGNAAGADVATITVPSFSAGGFDPETPGEMLMGAFERADARDLVRLFRVRALAQDVLRQALRQPQARLLADHGRNRRLQWSRVVVTRSRSCRPSATARSRSSTRRRRYAT